jgi:hypothetical protein
MRLKMRRIIKIRHMHKQKNYFSCLLGMEKETVLLSKPLYTKRAYRKKKTCAATRRREVYFVFFNPCVTVIAKAPFLFTFCARVSFCVV